MMYEDGVGAEKNKSNVADLQNLQFAMQAAGVGYWNIYLPEKENTFFDERSRTLLGLSTHQPISIVQVFESVHPNDEAAIETTLQNVLQQSIDTDIDISFRVMGTQKDVFNWVRLIGRCYCENEKANRLSGIVMDATPQKKLREELNSHQIQISAQALAHKEIAASEARFRTMVEQAPIAIGMLNSRNLIVSTANNAILKLWGKDETIIGLPLIDALPEIREQPFIGILEKVFDTGEPFFGYATMAKLVRQGILQDAYFDFVYTPMRDANEKITGVMVLATEVTAQVTAHLAVEESERRFRNMVEEAPVATCLFVGKNMKIEVANEKMINFWGKGWSVIGKPLIDAVPEIEGQPFLAILDEIYRTGKSYSAKDMPAELVIDGVLKTIYFDFTYKPLFNSAGEVYGIIDMAFDVTEQVVARKNLEESELFARSIIHNSPVAKLVVVGEHMMIKTANKHMLEMIGHDETIIGQPFEQALPELVDTPMSIRLKYVITTGQTYYQPEEKYELIRYGKSYNAYYNVIYKALSDITGKFYGVIVTAIEVTDHVNARIALETSEIKLKSLVDSAPFPIGVYTGKEMKIELANQSIIDVFGKGNDVIGKNYPDILPELKGQEIFEQLDSVYETGVPVHKRNQHVDIMVNGKLERSYFNYSLTPLFDTAGKVYGVMNTAATITDLVKAKQQVEQTEASLRGAVELAELGTWSYDFSTRNIDFSDRLKDWFGFEKNETITVNELINLVKDGDKQLIIDSMRLAMQPFSQHQFDVEYICVNKVTERERIIHAQGKVFFNELGTTNKVVGTAQDVTEQRKIQLALEQEVKLRTEELAASNQKLQEANEELEKTNDRLLHSNEELAQYAYVASHDLQEPLRKIRMFSSMLGGKELPKSDKDLIEKIRSSSERMSLLIQDLLDFSRLLKSETLMRPVDINLVMEAVTNDFELTINEKKATITISKLPVIEAVNLQMNQLFYNLLSNALKFTSPEKAPHISIQSKAISHQEAANYIPTIFPFSQYYHIIFADNGIGFESQYSEQIFEVFKRLHGRDVYPGSGIGLALCRRIVTNHNGYLFVESKPNEGTTFHIIFPDRQHSTQSSLPQNFNWTAN